MSLGVALGATANASAAVTCSHEATALSVATSTDLDVARVVMAGDEIRVLAGRVLTHQDELTPVACGGEVPTVANTDSVSIDEAANVDEGAVQVDLGGGPFAPGATPEDDGTSEIEFNVALNGDDGFLDVLGSPGPDGLDYAIQDAAVEVNLNAGAETQRDTDLTVTDVEIMTILGRDGADQITALTGSTSPLSFFFFGVVVGAGPGPDVLTGSAGPDLLGGDRGNDLILGADGRDFLLGGRGRDRVLGGAGRDTALVGDRDRDRVGCGPDEDIALVDSRDRTRGCERVRERDLPGPIGFLGF